MKPGHTLTKWWQDFVAGRLRTPQDLIAASRAERPDSALQEDRFTRFPVDNAVWDVPKRLSAPAYLASEAYAKQGHRADWANVDPRLQRWAAMVVMAARKRGIPLYVHCALRGKDEQDRLVAEGFSRSTYPNGAHNIGEAVDIVHSVYDWRATKDEWFFIHTLGQDCLRRLNAGLPVKPTKLAPLGKLHLNWGGDDQTAKDTFRWDPAHWEISDFRNRRRVLPPSEPVRKSPSAILRDNR